MIGNNAVQCTTPDLGNASLSEAMKQFLGVIDKKVRNMEKKKVSCFAFHCAYNENLANTFYKVYLFHVFQYSYSPNWMITRQRRIKAKG